MAKICCGGFELGEGLELNGKTLSANGGGILVVNVTNVNEDTGACEIDKTYEQIASAFPNVIARVDDGEFGVDGLIYADSIDKVSGMIRFVQVGCSDDFVLYKEILDVKKNNDVVIQFLEAE